MNVFIILLLFLGILVNLCQGYVSCNNATPCQNGGVCEKSTARCNCPETFYGELCEHGNACHPKCERNEICVVKGDESMCKGIECSELADVVCILDSSGSICDEEYQTMLDTIAAFINQFDIAQDKMRVGAFAFEDFIQKRIIKLNDFENKADLLAELMRYADDHKGGGTRTDKAIKYLRENVFTKANGDRESVPNTALIFTDGQSNRPNETRSEALKIKKANIHVIVIGIGDKINIPELRLIASDADDVLLTNFEYLHTLVDTLVSKTCDLSLDPCHESPCKHNGICRNFLTEYVCDCPPPYVGINCETKCNISGDIMIAIDESGSITPENFNKIIDAVMLFIKHLDITGGKVRLGFLTFALDVFVHYDLDSFNDKLDMLFVCNLLRYKYKGGPTFTHKALEYLNKYSFTRERGDREDYPNYVLIFTDGNSYYPWMTKKNAELLHASGISVNVIGVGPTIEQSELDLMASQPTAQHTFLTSFIRLELAMKAVIVQACEDLKPPEPCMKCRSDCNCPQGMKCCNKCCQDTTTILS